jgi:hypothetical protein
MKISGMVVVLFGALAASGLTGGCSSAKPQACTDVCACDPDSCKLTAENDCKAALALLQVVGKCSSAGGDAGGSDSGGGGNDSGGGGSDSGGGGGADCMEMSACCAKLPEPNKTKCTDIVDKGESYCQNYKANYCSLDPAACTKLQACCATLSGTDKSTCDLQVSTYGGDVELCGTALKQYPSCN